VASTTNSFLERAKGNLRRVDTHDETKDHSYLGRVVGGNAFKNPQLMTKEAPAGSSTQFGSGKKLGMPETTILKEATTPILPIGEIMKPTFETPLLLNDPDYEKQLRILDEDMNNLMRKLSMSEDQITKHQIRKDQNMAIQREAAIKAAEMRTLSERNIEEKNKALEKEFQMEIQRADAHHSAMELEMERAKAIAIEKANLDLQKIALQRMEEHEKGIQHGKALKERLEYQLKILRTNKELLQFENKMKDILSYQPKLFHDAVDVRYDVLPDNVEERRILDHPDIGRGFAVGRFAEEATTIGDSNTPLKDIDYHVGFVPH